MSEPRRSSRKVTPKSVQFGTNGASSSAPPTGFAIPTRPANGITGGFGNVPRLRAGSSMPMDVDVPLSSSNNNKWKLPADTRRASSRFSYSSDEDSNSDSDTVSTQSKSHGDRHPYIRRKYTRKSPADSYVKGRELDDDSNKVLRNREAAQQFRQRQREHLQQLQDEYEKLTEENRIYRENMSRLASQKEEVDKDLSYARSFLEQAMSIAMANMRDTNRVNQLEPILTRA